MEHFIASRKKELKLCENLLHVRAVTKKLKGEEFEGKQESVAAAEAAIAECEHLLSEIAAKRDVQTNLEKFKIIAKILILLIAELMKETNFYGGQEIYTDVLKDLCRATTKFMKIAE